MPHPPSAPPAGAPLGGLYEGRGPPPPWEHGRNSEPLKPESGSSASGFSPGRSSQPALRLEVVSDERGPRLQLPPATLLPAGPH